MHSVRHRCACGKARLRLPTYEEGLPDPNPPFDQFTTNRFNYPYTLRNNLTSTRSDHAWRAIYLENEYLKCSVLPDIGGHLYTCVDKISGKSMFYANPSIKKAAIAYRGAWAAFGVEFNFPVSHNWVTMSPVSFAFATAPDDGSASVTVGNVDRVYGMEWTVELILRPKSTRARRAGHAQQSQRRATSLLLVEQRWSCSLGRFANRLSHAFRGYPRLHRSPYLACRSGWRRLQHPSKITPKGPVSMFVHGSRENFMGVWNPHTNTGTVHFADYGQLPAKKIWSWGADADGLDWRKALSDDNSAYLEVQAGLFRNQETYAFLDPRQVIRFSEYWMPVREIGGIARANLSGVASLTRKSGGLLAGFNANAGDSTSHGFHHDKRPSSRARKELISRPSTPGSRKSQVSTPRRNTPSKFKTRKGLRSSVRPKANTIGLRSQKSMLGPQPAHRVPEVDQRTHDDWMQFAKDEELNGQNAQRRRNDTRRYSQKIRRASRLQKVLAAWRQRSCVLRKRAICCRLCTCAIPPIRKSPTISALPTMVWTTRSTRANPTNRPNVSQLSTPLQRSV